MIQDPDIFRQQEVELRRLASRLDDLKRQYDNYFVGLDKREPGLARARFDRALRDTKLHTTLSTVLRFKFRQFLARYRTYSTNWDRICREIEEGTYRRGSTTAAERLAAQRSEAALRRARGVDDALADDELDLGSDHRRLKDAAKQAEAFLASILGDNSGKGEDGATAQSARKAVAAKTVKPPAGAEDKGGDVSPSASAPPPPVLPKSSDKALPPMIRTTQPGPPPAVRITDADSASVSMRTSMSSGGGESTSRSPRMADSREGVEALYASYLHARRSQGDDISRVSLSSFARSVHKQEQKAREKLKSEDVVLKVKIRDGKVKLVASKAETKK